MQISCQPHREEGSWKDEYSKITRWHLFQLTHLYSLPSPYYVDINKQPYYVNLIRNIGLACDFGLET